MRKDKKKEPKSQEEKYIVSTDAEAVLYGLLFVLVGIIGLINSGPIGHFITYIFVYLFGAFYSIFFLFLMFLGLYLIFKKRFFSLKIDLKILGALFLLYSCMIGASLDSTMNIQNSFSYFSEKMQYIQEGAFHISDFSLIPYSGGGLLGFLSVGILNTMISDIGTKIVLIVLLITGSVLLFASLFKRIVMSIVKHINARRNLRKEVNKEKDLEKIEESAINNIVDKIDINENFNENNDNLSLYREEKVNPTSFFDDIEEKPVVLNDDDKDDFNDIEISSSNLEETRVDKPITISSFFEDEVIEEEIKNNETSSNNQNLFFDDNVEETKEEEKPITKNFYKQEQEELFSEKNTTITKTFENKFEQVPVAKRYIYPPISLLSTIFDGDKTSLNMQVADEYVNRINELFDEFNIGANVISYTIGPSVTRFDVARNAGVKLSQISGLQNELAQKLGGNETVRVELIVQGKTTSGIEVGNVHQTTVSFKECYQDLMTNTKDKLLIPLGKDISGNVVKTSIDELPHLLVAGTTGSGKSVFVHSIIMSLIMRNNPDELRLLMIDPKKVEFSKYHDLPHLLCPIISDNGEAVTALKRLVDEMERRYEVFAKYGNGANKYSEYIEYAREHNLELMPNIVMIVDEFADFISYNQKDVETSIQRIAQKARACGIYMILATQRPSVSIISGNIKANIPSRIALSVTSSTDSRVIIDESGAETLIGKGDLLAKVPISKSLLRVQSAFVPSKDIMAVCDFIREHSEVNYYKPFLDLSEKPIATFEGSAISSGRRTDLDPLHEEVKQFVLETKIASTSKIQNTFQMGFSRADYVLDCLEREGIVKRLPTGRRVVISSENEEI